ncbi:Os02g0216150, partial [Oryza sativa Japonica Group]
RGLHDMWGPRGSYAESAATWDKTGVKTAEGPFVTGFVSWGTPDVWFYGLGTILYLADKLRDLACTFP